MKIDDDDSCSGKYLTLSSTCCKDTNISCPFSTKCQSSIDHGMYELHVGYTLCLIEYDLRFREKDKQNSFRSLVC